MSAASSSSPVRDAARRAYERGRLASAAKHAVLFGVVLAVLAFVHGGISALAWVPGFVVAWTLLEHRGMSWLAGARAGAIGGALALLLPASAMESCCRAGCAMTGGACCKMAGGCIMMGAVIGLGVAGWLARRRDLRRAEAAFGAAIGMVATAVPRCSSMVLGEGAGLLAGLVAGTIATMLVSVAIDRARKTA